MALIWPPPENPVQLNRDFGEAHIDMIPALLVHGKTFRAHLLDFRLAALDSAMTINVPLQLADFLFKAHPPRL